MTRLIDIVIEHINQDKKAVQKLQNQINLELAFSQHCYSSRKANKKKAKEMKVLTIVKNDRITGIEYGIIEVTNNDKPQNKPQIKASKEQKSPMTSIHNNKRSQSKTTDNKKKLSQPIDSTNHVQQHAYMPLPCSYLLKMKKKAPVDLSRKRYDKALTLFKKHQRAIKLTQQFNEHQK